MCVSYIQEIDMVIKNLTQVASNWLPDSYAPDTVIYYKPGTFYHGKLDYTVVGFSDNVIDAKLMRTTTLRYNNLCCVMNFNNVFIYFILLWYLRTESLRNDYLGQRKVI